MLARTPSPTPSMHQSFEGPSRPAFHRRARSFVSFDLPLDTRERTLAILLFVAYACLRLLLVRTLSVNSDEPQHAHVAWAWSQGLVPYRDVFDNHVPLFHMLAAPLFRFLGETPDIILWLRLCMVPVSVVALACAYGIGRALWGRRVALLAMALTAVCPLYLRSAGEFRTDVLWAAAWLAAVAVAVCGPWRPRRAWLTGLLVGVAFAVSLKTLLLVAGMALAWLLVWAAMPPSARPSLRTIGGHAGRIALAACIVPACVVALVAVKGGLAAMHYDVITHNVLPGLGETAGASVRWVRLGALALLAAMALWPVRHAANPGRAVRRALVVASAAIYGLLLLGGWPLLAPQDNLPVLPLMVLGLVAGWERLPLPAAPKVAVPVGLALAGLALLVGRHAFWQDRTAESRGVRAQVLAMTTPQDPVFDDKGDAVFRQRPYYFALETITLERLRRGLLPDDIAERLVATNTHVVWSRRLPARDRAFVEQNYLPLGRDLNVAGSDLGWLAAGTRREAFIRLPGLYALVSNGAHATLDGVAYAAPRFLEAGSHIIETAEPGHYLLVWAPAATRLAVAAR